MYDNRYNIIVYAFVIIKLINYSWKYVSITIFLLLSPVIIMNVFYE